MNSHIDYSCADHWSLLIAFLYLFIHNVSLSSMLSSGRLISNLSFHPVHLVALNKPSFVKLIVLVTDLKNGRKIGLFAHNYI